MPDEPEADAPRQRVVRVPGARRAKLTPVTGTDASSEPAPRTTSSPKGPKGPNDDRMLQDVPPHY
ncbi:hypothetical protein [Microbacterium sp. NPDC087665]|uniref:hypothetical protein n=1 Tax=Microbacterium sp. NPDC087665 TaxID=3364194 RepID=UPI00382358DF